jgi:hypothetical protein
MDSTLKVDTDLYIRDTTIIDLIVEHSGEGLTGVTSPTETFLGVDAGSSTTGNYNTFIGHTAGGANITGLNNVYLGRYTGRLGTGGHNNTFIGMQAGYNNTATGNVFMGFDAGYSNTTGNGNTFLGYNSGKSNSTGGENTFVGDETGLNINGYQNNAFGVNALKANTNGWGNLAIGYGTMELGTTGSYNVALGQDVLHNNSGNNNVAIGYESGFLNTSGSNNVFIGKEAGRGEMGSNKLYIENSNSTTPLIGGDFSTDEVTINGDLEVTGTIKGVMQVAKASVVYTNTSQTTIITLPANAVIWDMAVEVITIFNGSGTDLLDVGIAADGDKYDNDDNISVVYFGAVAIDGVAGYTGNLPDRMSASTNVTFQYTDQSSDATQGQASVYIHYTTH